MMALPTELKTGAALELIGRTYDGQHNPLLMLPKRKPPLGRGSPGRRPWMFATVDILRVRDLVRCGVSLPAACRVRRAELEGRLPKPPEVAL